MQAQQTTARPAQKTKLRRRAEGPAFSCALPPAVPSISDIVAIGDGRPTCKARGASGTAAAAHAKCAGHNSKSRGDKASFARATSSRLRLSIGLRAQQHQLQWRVVLRAIELEALVELTLRLGSESCSDRASLAIEKEPRSAAFLGIVTPKRVPLICTPWRSERAALECAIVASAVRSSSVCSPLRLAQQSRHVAHELQPIGAAIRFRYAHRPICAEVPGRVVPRVVCTPETATKRSLVKNELGARVSAARLEYICWAQSAHRLSLQTATLSLQTGHLKCPVCRLDAAQAQFTNRNPV